MLASQRLGFAVDDQDAFAVVANVIRRRRFLLSVVLVLTARGGVVLAAAITVLAQFGESATDRSDSVTPDGPEGVAALAALDVDAVLLLAGGRIRFLSEFDVGVGADHSFSPNYAAPQKITVQQPHH